MCVSCLMCCMQVDYIVLGRMVAIIQTAKADVAGYKLKPKLITW